MDPFEGLIDNTRKIETLPEDHSWEESDEALRGVLQALAPSFVVRAKRMVPFGIAPDDINPSYAELVKVGVAMTPAAQAYVKSQVTWSELYFGPADPHDHPVSHFLTEVNEGKVVERFGKQPFIDLFGNPKRHERYGRNHRSYYAYKAPKDWLRDHRGVSNATEFTSIDKMLSTHASVKHVLMTHSAYYLQPADFGEILYHGKLAGIRRIYAIVHRHDRTKGELNNGELEYEYDQHGIVHQRSKITGEGYKHPSFEPYFHQSVVETRDGPITWTTRKLAGDTFLVEFVACPGYKGAPKGLALGEYTEEEILTVEGTSHFKVRSFFGKSWVEYAGPNGAKHLDDVGLFNILRRYVAGRPRDAATHKDLTLLARRLCDKRDIFAKYSAEHDIPPQDLMWYVEAAFHADLEAEIDLMLSFRQKHHDKLSLHASLMTDPSLHSNSWLSTAAAAGSMGYEAGLKVAQAAPTVASAVEAMADVATSAALQVPLVLKTGKVGLHQGVTRSIASTVSSALGYAAGDAKTALVHDAHPPAATSSYTLLESLARTHARTKEAPDRRQALASPPPEYAPRLPPRPPKQ